MSIVHVYRALDLAGAFWFLERPLFRESFKAFGLEGLWGFCENGGVAPLVFLLPCNRGDGLTRRAAKLTSVTFSHPG